MSKYMLKRGQRAQSYVGFKFEGEGRARVRKNIEVPMWQGMVADTDIDLDHWVLSGVMIKIKEIVKAPEEPMASPISLPPPPVPTISPALQESMLPEVKVESVDSIERFTSPMMEEDEMEDGADGAEDDSDSDSDMYGGAEDDSTEVEYEELEDHTYKCLVCAKEGIDKILKTEDGILKHIEAKH